MKFNFRKIVSVLATTVMLGSTVAFASAAWPEPFVKDGAGAAALVVGSGTGVAASDMAAATNIQTALNAKVTVTSGTSVEGGDSVKIEKTNDKFNIGDALNSVYTTLDSEDFSTVLKDGTYLNQNNNDYDYEQSISLSAEPLIFYYDKDYNDRKPSPGFFMARGDHVLNYTVDFTDAAECGAALADCDNTNIEMLGKTFFISNAENTTTNDVKLTMLDSANVASIAEGETKTVTVGDKSYEVSIDFVSSSETKLSVNNVITNALNEGETFKLADGTFVGVKDISYNSKDTGISKVEFTLGMGKLVLENGKEVQLNDEAISTIEDANGVSSVITSYITRSTNDITSIVLSWKLDKAAVIAPGASLTMPGFNAIKIDMAAFNAPVQEKTTIDDGNNNIDITTTVKDGAVTLPLLYANASVSGFAGLGEDSTHLLKTNSSTGTSGAYVYLSLNLSTEDMFVATYINGDDSESYVFEIESITEGSSAKNATTLDNLASGGSNIEFSEVGDTKDRGSFTFLLDAASADDEWARVGVKASSGTVYLDRLVTKEGLQMRLPVVVNVTTATDGQFNMNASVLANPTTWAMNFTEEDENGNVALLTESFTVTLGLDNGDGTEPTATAFSTASTSYEEERNSDWGVGMQTSALATKVRYYNPSNGLGSVEILYAGEESYADVYVSEAGTTVAGSASIKVVKDSEVDSVQDKNLIVVGGSCINSVAAKMLGSDTPLCGDAWATKTNAGVGKYLIKVAASPYNAQKIAVLVAGYDAADTTKAAEKVATEGVEATVGETVYPLASA